MHNKLANSHSPSKPYLAGLVVPVRELHAGHRDEILRHLLLLNEEDRRLRFGTQTPDEVIHHYVEGLDFNKDTVFGSFDSQLNLIGMAHLAYLPKTKGQPQSAEFGVSVLPDGRGQGIGTALLARASVHSRNTRIETLFVHCLANNRAMMHLAQKVACELNMLTVMQTLTSNYPLQIPALWWKRLLMSNGQILTTRLRQTLSAQTMCGLGFLVNQSLVQANLR